MKIENYKAFKEHCLKVLQKSIGDDYAGYIYTCLSGDLIEDVETACDGEVWNEDDIRMAVGRTLCNRLGIEIY